MKLKDVIQIAVLTVIGFAIGMAISMLTGTLGAIALYASAGFAAFAVGPVFVITAKNKASLDGRFILGYLRTVIYPYGLLDNDTDLFGFGSAWRNHHRRLFKQCKSFNRFFGCNVCRCNAPDYICQSIRCGRNYEVRSVYFK